MKILYSNNKDLYGYKKIIAIKPDDFIFGSEELKEDNFGILSADMTETKIKAWSKNNKYCINDAEEAIITTPAEYQLKDPEAIPEFIIPEQPVRLAPKAEK